MEDYLNKNVEYNKIIESLGVRFNKAKNIRILQPLAIDNYYDVENTVILLNKGELRYGTEKELVDEGDVLFIPGGKSVPISYGSGNHANISNEEFISNKEKYFQHIPQMEQMGDHESFSYVSFDAKVFDSVNFFASLDIPPFLIKANKEVVHYIRDVIAENNATTAGKDRIVKISTERLVIEVVRHIIKNRLFVEKLATNSTYFKDPRLIDIFNYIKENVGGDLSNKVLASVANVSEDYVGQYFKMLTSINPQDYIEYQRMEMAVNLLRTTKKSIREIGKEVGYKDTAYFCRRFKMMFGIPAGKMRRRETLMNI
jgi:AraC-like DNA-binding protein